MLSFKITITGIDRVIQQLDSTREVLTDLYPEWQIVGDYLVIFFSNDVFETEGSVFGEPWADLSPSYAIWKGKNYPGRGILERTGTLRYGFIAQPSSNFLIIANNTPYGAAFKIPKKSNMPARVFMRIDSERADIINNLILESLNQRISDSIG